MELVHITDLHYANNNAFQKALIEGLLNDLRLERAKGLAPDALIFSGDLVNNPDDRKIYDHFEDEFLLPVLGVLGLAPHQVVFCPGNHDLSFTQIKKQKMIYDSLQSTGKQQATATAQSKTKELKKYATEISGGFFALMKKYGNAWENPFFHVYNFAAINTSFIALNSAYSCCLEGSPKDRGSLVFPVDDALAAFQAANKGSRVMSLGHHPLTEFNEETARGLIPIVEKRSLIHFFGHVHQAKPATTTSSIGTCFMVQGGALYERAGQYNGYSIIRISDDDKGHVSAEYHTYYVDRQEFDVGTNVVKGGTFFNNSAAQTYFDNRIRPASDDEVAYWLMDHIDGVVRKYDDTLTNRKLLDTFVEPLIVQPRQGEKEKRDNSAQKHVSVKELISGTDHIVIATDHEYGATALLQYVCMTLFKQCAEMVKPVVPVLLDARRLKSYANSIQSSIRAELPESNEASLKLQPLHDGGRLVLLIDDFDPLVNSHVEAVAAIRVLLPKARLVIAAKLPMIYTEHLKPVIGVDKFTFLQLRPLNRGRVRSLVERWKLPAGYQTETVVEEVVARFRALGIPLTPAHVVIYLSILEDVKGFNPVNSSNVIEQFIESILDKYKPEYNLRSAFDYRNQIDFLSAMAERMSRENKNIVEYNEFFNWAVEYFDDIGIRQDAKSIIELFHNNKIFAIEGEVVAFRYNLYLSFFVAQRMLASSEFKQWILSEERYMNYVVEIDLYCGLSRNDVAILDFLGAEFAKFNQTLAELVAPLSWDAPLERLQLPRVEDQSEFAENISKQLSQEPMPAEERDAALGDAPQRQNRPALQRPDVQGILPKWILSLRAYTVALKNLENIPRLKKEEHLPKAMEGWATLIRYACLLFRELITKPVIEVGPMRFMLALPEKTPNEFLRMVFLSIPTEVSHWVRQDLGSQKLEMQLKRDDLAPSITMAFLATGLFADMKLGGFIERLSSLHEKIKSSQFFMEALILKMRDIYLRFGLTHEEQLPFQKLAAELSADAKGLKGKARLNEIDSFARKLRQRGQLAKLKDLRG